MLLAWRELSLRETCRTREGVMRRWPIHGHAARLLLSTVCHARDLGQLSRVRSVLVEPSRSDTAIVLVSLEEVQMEAIVLTQSADPVTARPLDDFLSVHAGARSLLVVDLCCQGQSLVKATAS